MDKSKRLLLFPVFLLFNSFAGGAGLATSVPSVKAHPPDEEKVERFSPSGVSHLRLNDLEGPQVLRMLVGKSLLVNSPKPLTRVSVTNPEIASALILSPQQVLVHSKLPGNVTLLLWDERGRTYPFELQVELDLRSLQQTVQRVFPQENVHMAQSGAALVLSGNVSSEKDAEQILALAQMESQNVVNMLNTVQSDEVLLQVRFAEVNRAAIQNLGINIISTGAANTPGVISTQQQGTVLGNVGAVPASAQRGSDPQAPSLISGGVGNRLKGSPSVFGLTDLLNIFVFRPDLNLALAIRALEQRNLLQILAEPSLLAIDGKEASFLAGGEFPFPVVQGGTNFTAVTIQFKEFGVRLTFTPNILKDGTIRLKVTPEVSALDFSNALSISGFLVPALSTRRASTEVELRSGQSFAIAGLIDNRLTEIASKIPVLGDVPFLGKLFRSRSLNQTNTELLVMVTPRLVKELSPDQVASPPDFPELFLDKEKFDQER